MKNKYAALFLGWLVPGLGHIYAGKKWKGAILFAALMTSAMVGVCLGRFQNVYFAPTHYQFYAEIGNGLFTMAISTVARVLSAAPIERTAHGGYLANMLPIADLYLMMAGLLNFVAAANAFDLVARERESKE
jgi:hypothetical protein